MDQQLLRDLRKEVAESLSAPAPRGRRQRPADDDAPRTSASSPARSSPACSRVTPPARSPPAARRRRSTEESRARRGHPRRAVRRRPAPAAARRPRGREHRHQRLRQRLRRLRQRRGEAVPAGRRERRGAGRAGPGARRLLVDHQPPLRHRQPAARPAPARRQPPVRRDGRVPAAVAVDPSCAHPAGQPRHARRERLDEPRGRRLPVRGRRGPQEHHDRGRHQRRQDDAAARARQRDPARRAADHRRARPRARARRVRGPAPQRGRVRGAAAQLRGPGRDPHERAGAPFAAHEPQPRHRRRGARRRDRHDAQRDEPGQRRLALHDPRELLARGVQPHLHLRDPVRRAAARRTPR